MFSSIQFNRIKGLIPSYPELGKIKIGQLGPERTSQGGKKFRLPEKLDHFRVTLRVRGADGQFALDEDVHKALGPQPKELPVTLVYDDPTLNCPSRLNCYDGSRRWCHGNGEQALRLDGQGIYRERPCPCALLTSPEEAEENTKRSPHQLLKCKPYGVLRVQLPIKQGSIGVYGFRTTSSETISNLLAVQASVLLHTGGVLGGIPLRLRLYPATDNTPGGPSKSWKVTLDLPPGGWEEVDEAAKHLVQARLTTRLDMKAIEAAHRKALAAVVERPEEAEAIIDELFPKPILVIDGVEIVEDEPDPEAEPQAGTAPHAPPAPAPTEDQMGQPVVPLHTPAAEEPPPPDAVLQFQEAYLQEGKAGSDEVKYAAVADQHAALKALMERKGAALKDGWTVEKLTRPRRKEWFDKLQQMPDAQAGLPWA